MKNMNLKTTLILLLSIFFAAQVSAQKDTTELDMGKKKLIIIDKKTKDENAVYNLEKGKQTFEDEIRKTEELIRKHEEMIKHLEEEIQASKGEKNNHIDFEFDSFDHDMTEKEIIQALKDLEKDSIDPKSMHYDFYFKDVDPNDVGNVEDNVKIIMKDFDVEDDNIEIIISDNGDIYLNNEKLINQKELERLEAELEKHEALIELNEKKKEAFENGIREIDRGIKELEDGLKDIDSELAELDDVQNEDGKHIHNKKRFNSHLAGFEIGLFNFMNGSQSIASDNDADFLRLKPERSMNYGLNIFEFNIPISKYSFGIGTGAGLEWNSMSLVENINLVENADGVIEAEYVDPNLKDFKRNKFNAAYVKVPVIFELQIPVGSRKLYFGAGVTGSIRGWSKQKQTYFIDGRKFKDKKTDDFQLSPFRYGLTARIGYGSFGFFVNYELVPLFKEGKGPELYPVMVGLHLVDF